MTSEGVSLLASRLSYILRAVGTDCNVCGPQGHAVSIDGHDAAALLELAREVLQLRDEQVAWKAKMYRAEFEVDQWQRRAETIRGLLDQANVDLHVESEVERQAHVEAHS